jgi:hypothetical protein
MTQEEADAKNLTPYQLQQKQEMMDRGYNDMIRMKKENPDSMMLRNFQGAPRKHKYGTPESIAAGGFDSQGNAIKELTMALKENTGATKDNSKTSKSGTSANMPMRKTVSAGAMGR